jgi:predicted nucleic acid-binding protein
MDCLIANAAICHEPVLVRTDRDFETIAAVSDLQQRWLSGI